MSGKSVDTGNKRDDSGYADGDMSPPAAGREGHSQPPIKEVLARWQAKAGPGDHGDPLKARQDAVLPPADGAASEPIEQIVDVQALQDMADSFYDATGVVLAILDLKGNILVTNGWQDICTQFHRCHPETARNCRESDLHLSGSVKEGEYVLYRCKNGLNDIVTPILVDGRHIANLYSGQFLFDDEKPDYGFFRRQAQRYGFEETAYIAALDRVPRLSRDKVRKSMEFYTKFAGMISKLSYSNARLVKALDAQRRAEEVLQAQAKELEARLEAIRASNERLEEVTRSLQESEEKYRELVEHANSLIVRWDIDGRITFFNEYAERFFGYAREEITGRDVMTLIPSTETSGRNLTAMIETIKRFPERYEKNVNENVRKNGERIWVSWTNRAILDAHGNVVGILSVGTDITAQYRAEEEMKEAKAQSELYLDLMGHDISNMHQIILGQLEMAQAVRQKDRVSKGEDREYIDTAIATLGRSARLIKSVQQLQKLKAGYYGTEIVDLGKVLDEAVGLYASVPGRDVTINYASVPGCLVKANPLMKEIFHNLLDNAVKHSDDPVAVTVGMSEVERDGRRYYRVDVADNGHGIPDSRKQAVFGMFQRGRTRAKGNGLGLYLVSTLAQSLQGYVEVTNRVPGDYTQGSRFSVYLPVAEGDDT